MENNEKIFIEINKKKLNKLDYSLSDILCFVDGLEATNNEILKREVKKHIWDLSDEITELVNKEKANNDNYNRKNKI